MADQPFNATVYMQNRLHSADEFGNIYVKTDAQGGAVRLHDVARIEIGGEGYEKTARYNGRPAAGLAIKLSTNANALETAERIRAKLDDLSNVFPSGMAVKIATDTTPFINISIDNVVHTLVEAVALGFLVMYLFMKNFRATLIPTIAVPVVLLGTFGVLAVFGYSINTLTLFAMVLAIGLLVDDAIVVVENVERVMQDEGLSPKEATRKSMGQITGALVGIALVLSAVFIPMAFFAGSVGVIYRQFSVTIVAAMVLSVIVAIVLTPALCATLLKPVSGTGKPAKGFFAWFNRVFERSTRGYVGGVGGILNRPARFGLIYLLLVAGVAGLYQVTPTGFLPDEDQGMLFSQIMMPPGSTRERTLEVIKQVEQHFLENEKAAVESVTTVAGFNFAGTGQNTGFAFMRLRDWSERESPELWADAVIGRAMGKFSQIKEAMVVAFGPPAVPEMGNAKGFDVFLQDKTALGRGVLLEARNQLLGMAAKDPGLVTVRPNGQEPAPILQVEVDREKSSAFGLDLATVNNTLSAAWGSSYVDDFINNGQVKKVYLQADAEHRAVPSDLNKWTVRNAQGEMVLFSSIAAADWSSASPKLERYNGLPAVEILGENAPGWTSGEAMNMLESFTEELPEGLGLAWTGLSSEERASGEGAMWLYALSLLIVFLALAALYESWAIPFSVMLVVPLGALGTLLAAAIRVMPNDVYFQVGLLTIIGLSSKNAILIVEFAKELVEQGRSVSEAALEAARLRFRPILMTSLAFGFGVLPLAISTGAGAGSQNALGTGVLGGMLSATVLGVFFIPWFFVLVVGLFQRRQSPEPGLAASSMKKSDQSVSTT